MKSFITGLSGAGKSYALHKVKGLDVDQYGAQVNKQWIVDSSKIPHDRDVYGGVSDNLPEVIMSLDIDHVIWLDPIPGTFQAANFLKGITADDGLVPVEWRYFWFERAACSDKQCYEFSTIGMNELRKSLKKLGFKGKISRAKRSLKDTVMPFSGWHDASGGADPEKVYICNSWADKQNLYVYAVVDDYGYVAQRLAELHTKHAGKIVHICGFGGWSGELYHTVEALKCFGTGKIRVHYPLFSLGPLIGACVNLTRHAPLQSFIHPSRRKDGSVIKPYDKGHAGYKFQSFGWHQKLHPLYANIVDCLHFNNVNRSSIANYIDDLQGRKRKDDLFHRW